jgi:hypothetical protein
MPTQRKPPSPLWEMYLDMAAEMEQITFTAVDMALIRSAIWNAVERVKKRVRRP